MLEGPPESCRVTLKEWSGVCEALRDGRQSILLRKGGIAEESGRFRAEQGAFWLYPTHVHQQVQGLKWPAGTREPAAAGEVELGLFALVTDVHFVEREAVLDRIEAWHALTPETVRSRFRYRRPGLWLLAVRVYRTMPPRRISIEREHEGCKSWVPLARPLPTGTLIPALDDAEYGGRIDALHRALDVPAGL